MQTFAGRMRPIYTYERILCLGYSADGRCRRRGSDRVFTVYILQRSHFGRTGAASRPVGAVSLDSNRPPDLSLTAFLKKAQSVHAGMQKGRMVDFLLQCPTAYQWLGAEREAANRSRPARRPGFRAASSSSLLTAKEIADGEHPQRRAASETPMEEYFLSA